MSQVIWKTQLKPVAEQNVTIPKGAKFLFTHEQYRWVCVWYLCDPNAEMENRTIFIYGTGHEVDSIQGTYLGSALQLNERLVWHIFIK